LKSWTPRPGRAADYFYGDVLGQQGAPTDADRPRPLASGLGPCKWWLVMGANSDAQPWRLNSDP